MNMYSISGTTRLGGLLGSPVAHSISPAMHNYAFRRLGIDCVYLAFDVGQEKVGEIACALRDMGSYGFNLTMPDKKKIMEYLDELSDAAEITGAVNTVVIKDGRMTGHNTDGCGFVQAAKDHGIDPEGIEAVVLGAGGAGQAVAAGLALAGAKAVHIANRKSKSFDAAIELADRIERGSDCRADVTDLEDRTELKGILDSSSLVINATPLGMGEKAALTPLSDLSLLHEGMTAADLIYEPRQTRFLKEAAGRGLRTFNGMHMLLYQGAEAFRLWTGQEMGVEEVRKEYFS